MNDENLNLIISGCLKNNRKSQKQLYELFLPYVKSLARRYLFDTSFINDVTHDIFIKIFVRIKTSYDIKKGPLKPWIAKLAINTIYDFNGKTNTHKTEEITEQVATSKINNEVFLDYERDDLFELVLKMPATLRTVFNMYIIDELSHAEIAQILNCSPLVSRKRLSRARTWLKDCIQNKKDNSMRSGVAL